MIDLNRRFMGAVAGALIALGASEARADEIGDAGRGRGLAELRCGGCHATEKTGVSPLPAAPPFRELHLRYEVEDLAEALAEGIVTGHPDMPSTPFSAQEARDLIAYLKTLESEPVPSR